MTTTTAPKLLCPECRRENEPQRVYCHECGTRLDRSVVLTKKEPIKDTHKRVKRMFDPKRGRMRARFVAMTRLVVGAGLLATVVEMFLPPDVPPRTKNPVMASSLRLDLENMVTKHQPPKKQVDENAANAFIASVVRSRRARLNKPLLSFQRGLVAFHPNRCSVTVERWALDYWPVYTTCVLTPELKDGRLTATVEAGYIGRLPIHPKVARYMEVLFIDMLAAFNSDLKSVSKLNAIELQDKTLTLTATAP